MIAARTPAFWRATLALSLGSLLTFANLYTPQPLLPLFSETWGISPVQASLTVSLTTLALSISLLVYGPLSDAIGRRGIMFVSMTLTTLCSLAMAFAPDFWSLLALRTVQGLVIGGLLAVAMAYMGDEFEHDAMVLAVGLYISGNSLGGISGRLISGGVASVWGWQGSFLVTGCLSLVILVIFIWMLPPSRGFRPKPLHPVAMLADLGRHLRNPVILLACLVGGLNFLVFINIYNYITYLLSAPPYNLSPALLGLLFLTYLSGTLAAGVSGRIVGTRSQPLAMVVGLLILISGTLLTLVPHLEAIILGMVINAIGFFFTHTQAAGWVSRKADGARASASSLYLMSYYGGASVGSFYLGPFWHWLGWDGVVLGAVIMLCVAIGVALGLRVLERRDRAALPADPEHDPLPDL
ncbi:major facilitator superfamily MFS_1 [Thiorhodococcus drewsii AZ1]|uniref:Major facilitator superfamily MFS_1 n=1 Tax=Thiorhodococcus drewsii AZ1 TaxID=765913 RepID=G2DX69_9GAMM|nr:MFS transporter [Thiorhodococcus drewsii]EGV33423.1 major facilitator superfamily MFS_1 [Thiorhodococcus drewsii AZ1]